MLRFRQNKSKAPKPEGKFQKRMREMMEKAQEEQQNTGAIEEVKRNNIL